MANTFKNYVSSSSIGTTETTVYTVPASTTAVIIGLNVANVETDQIKISVELNSVYLVKDVPIPAGSALAVLDGKIIAETGDTISVTSDTADSADVVVSVLEQT